MTDNELDILINAELLRDVGIIDGVPLVSAWVNKEYPHTCLTSCPHCGRLHQHSTPTEGEPSPRVSHCWSGVKSNNGYYLYLQDEEIPAEILEADRIMSDIWRQRFKKSLMRNTTSADEIILREMTTE